MHFESCVCDISLRSKKSTLVYEYYSTKSWTKSNRSLESPACFVLDAAVRALAAIQTDRQ